MNPRWFALALFAPCLFAADLCSEYQDRLARLKTSKDTDKSRQIAELIQPGRNGSCFAAFVEQGLRRNNFLTAVKKLEQLRTDQQAGASAGGGATTSLVSKGVVAKSLSVAAEYGAVTEAVNGQAVTVSGSLDGVPTALVRKGIIYYCIPGVSPTGCAHRKLFEVLRRFSYGVTFDTSTNQTTTGTAATGGSGNSSATTQPVTFTASRHQISSVTGQAALWNNRDVNSQDFQDKWKKQLDPTTNPNLDKAAQAALAGFQTFMNAIQVPCLNAAAKDPGISIS